MKNTIKNINAKNQMTSHTHNHWLLIGKTLFFFKVGLTPEFYQPMSRTKSVNEFYFEGVGCEREGLVPRGVWGWVQGVGRAQGVTRSLRQSVWDGLWRPGTAFFQIGLGCVMSHRHIEGLCLFLFKFLQEKSVAANN